MSFFLANTDTLLSHKVILLNLLANSWLFIHTADTEQPDEGKSSTLILALFWSPSILKEIFASLAVICCLVLSRSVYRAIEVSESQKNNELKETKKLLVGAAVHFLWL